MTACDAAVELPPKINPKYLTRLVKVVGRLRDLDVQEKVLTEEVAPELGTGGRASIGAGSERLASTPQRGGTKSRSRSHSTTPPSLCVGLR